MRSDRIIATLLILQASGTITAADLAKELEVSVKTARRDLEALAAAGVPVYARPGRGGGWQLLGGGRTDLSGLTAAEVRALFLIAGPRASLSPEVASALRKLRRALPEPFRADASAAAGAISLDPIGWGNTQADGSRHRQILERAIMERQRVRLRYGRSSTAVTTRIVHPLGLIEKERTWYLLGDTRAGRRSFRLDRIRSATPTGTPSVRPADFDLAGAWRSVVGEVEIRRSRVEASVVASQDAAAGLRTQFGGDLRIHRRRPDGRLDLRIAGASAEQLAERLAGWGDEIMIQGPADLHQRLAKIGWQLVDRYGRTRR